MPLSTQTISQVVSNFAAAVQGAASALVDFTVGSILRAIGEANAGIVMWLQGLVLQVAALTRAATSNGSDLDSWMGDFAFARLPAVAATGQVAFSRFSAGQQAVVPVGAVVRTADGTQSYTVALDAANAAYNAGLGGYVIAAGAPGVSVTVVAVAAGSAGNAAAGAVNTIAQAIPYVDTVVNAAPFSTGEDQESDAAFRARFVLYLGQLSKATLAAIQYTLEMLGVSGNFYSITENYNYAGAYTPGSFYVVASDGTASPSSGFLSNVAAAVNAIRGLGIQIAVYGPTAVNVTVSGTITTASGYTHSAVVALVEAAIQTYVNGLGIGQNVSWSKLYQVIYEAGAGVADATGLLLNGGTSDIAITEQEMAWATSVLIS